MTDFELYMLVTGWSGLDILCEVAGILICMLGALAIAICIEERYYNHARKYAVVVLLGAIVWIASAFVPDQEDMIKWYSAKQGAQKVHQMLNEIKKCR